MTTAKHRKDTLFAETLFVKALVAFVLVILAGLTIASLATTMVYSDGIEVSQVASQLATKYPLVSLLVLFAGGACIVFFRHKLHRTLSSLSLGRAYAIHALFVLLVGTTWIFICEAPPEQTKCTALTGQS